MINNKGKQYFVSHSVWELVDKLSCIHIYIYKNKISHHCLNLPAGAKISLVNTQIVSVTKIVDSSSMQCAESKYGLRIQFLALVFMVHEVWLNA
jgi:hypothetical protein